MCELFGFTLAKTVDISDCLRTFFSHSNKNPHGWGMMYETDRREILKEAVSAEKSSFLNDIIDYMPPQKTALAHISFSSPNCSLVRSNTASPTTL